MAAPSNIQLGSLDFDDIRQSIIDYLKEQDTLKDYDYAGSALQTLVDVLAYNTMYYGHYANMVANEMFLDTAQREESLISLVKPLGYVVPGRTSAKATTFIRQGGGAGTLIPRYTRFSGRNNQGTSFNFYTTEDISLDVDGESIFVITEGKNLIKEIPIIIDSISQKSFISGIDTDISTIRIEVLNTEDKENTFWEEWYRASNIETGLDETSKVFWLERSELGFFVVFGGNLGSATSVQIGKTISENDQVRISYFKSSGDDANDVGAFTIQGIGADTNQTISNSAGGSDSPNLEAIRFFAPKWFAAQDRAVTVEDCRAVLGAAGIASDTSDPYVIFNVWGGEEMDPPRYGRVFVTTSNEDSNGNPIGFGEYAVQKDLMINTLRSKMCVSILPEFINPVPIDVNIAGTIYYDPLKTPYSELKLEGIVKQELVNKYPKKFKNNISAVDISNYINALNSRVGEGTFNAEAGAFSFTASNTIISTNTESNRNAYFRNVMQPGSLTSTSLPSLGNVLVGTVESGFEDKVRLRSKPGAWVAQGGWQTIEAYYDYFGTIVVLRNVGKWQPDNGRVILRDDICGNGDKYDIRAKLTTHLGSQVFSGKEELLTGIAVTDLILVNKNVY